MREPLFLVALAAIGYAAMLRLLGLRERAACAALAVPVGAFAWTLACIALLVVHIPPRHAVYLTHLAGVVLAVRTWREESLQPFGRCLLAAFLLGVLALAWLAARWGWVMLSFDSVEQVAVGRYFATYGWRTSGPLLASWGSLVPLVQGAGVGLGVDLMRAFQPAMAASLLLLGIWAAWRLSPRLHWLSALVVAGGLVACQFLVLQSQYVHNSLPSAVYLAGAVALYALAVQRADAVFLRPAFLCLAAFCFCRTEAPLFAAFVLVLGATLAPQGPVSAEYRRMSRWFCALVCAWCGVLLLVIGAGSDIMTPGRVLVLIGVLLVATAAVHLLQHSALLRVRALTPELVVLATLAALAVAFAWDPVQFGANLKAVEGNMATSGRWGSSWLALALAAPLTLRRTPACRHAVAFAVAFFGLLVLLGMARTPYRLGWGDSANRILTHLWPLLLLFTVVGASGFRPLVRARYTTMRTLTLLATFGLAAGLSGAVVAMWPNNVAARAVVRDAPGFCPADEGGRHDFGIALVPASRKTYAAACSPGPRRVVLELDGLHRPRHLRLLEYGPDQAWRDFSIATSVDGTSWETQYDTGVPELRDRARRLAPAQSEVRLDGSAVRFVRIEFRGADGQNRLILRRLVLF